MAKPPSCWGKYNPKWMVCLHTCPFRTSCQIEKQSRTQTKPVEYVRKVARKPDTPSPVVNRTTQAAVDWNRGIRTPVKYEPPPQRVIITPPPAKPKPKLLYAVMDQNTALAWGVYRYRTALAGCQTKELVLETQRLAEELNDYVRTARAEALRLELEKRK